MCDETRFSYPHVDYFSSTSVFQKIESLLDVPQILPLREIPISSLFRSIRISSVFLFDPNAKKRLAWYSITYARSDEINREEVDASLHTSRVHPEEIQEVELVNQVQEGDLNWPWRKEEKTGCKKRENAERRRWIPTTNMDSIKRLYATPEG